MAKRVFETPFSAPNTVKCSATWPGKHVVSCNLPIYRVCAWTRHQQAQIRNQRVCATAVIKLINPPLQGETGRCFQVSVRCLQFVLFVSVRGFVKRTWPPRPHDTTSSPLLWPI